MGTDHWGDCSGYVAGGTAIPGAPQFGCSKPAPDRLWGFARGHDDDASQRIDGALWVREVNTNGGCTEWCLPKELMIER